MNTDKFVKEYGFGFYRDTFKNAIVFILLLAPFAVAAVTVAPYLPLTTGYQWSLQTNGLPGVTETVDPGTYSVNGYPARRINSSDGSQGFYSNDANGLQIHQEYLPPGGGYGAETDTYSPPFKYALAEMSVGVPLLNNGTMTSVIGGLGTYQFAYSAGSTLLGFEIVTVPAGTFNTAKLLASITFTGNVNGTLVTVSVTKTIWTAKNIGRVKEVTVSSGTGIGTAIDTDELTATNFPLTQNTGTAVCWGDFNNDGKSDLIWHQTSTGGNIMWVMNGVVSSSSAYLGGGSDWNIIATGDFNGDGKSDLIWRQASTGGTVIWLMNGGVMSNSAFLGGDADWRVVATGDFNGDGKADVVWRQTSTGATVLWLMNGTVMSSSAYLGGSSDWTVTATGDFNGDTKTDLVWRQASTGASVVWLMNGSAMSSSAYLGGSTDWTVVATGDFNGDTKTDLVWRQASTGASVVWLMNGSAMSSSAYLGGSTDWSIAATGDFNGDTKSDLVWRQVSTGGNVLWLMNGTSSSSTAYLGGSADWSVGTGE